MGVGWGGVVFEVEERVVMGGYWGLYVKGGRGCVVWEVDWFGIWFMVVVVLGWVGGIFLCGGR